jgi:hypothetical protein
LLCTISEKKKIYVHYCICNICLYKCVYICITVGDPIIKRGIGIPLIIKRGIGIPLIIKRGLGSHQLSRGGLGSH